MSCRDTPPAEIETAAIWYSRLQDDPTLERSDDFQFWLRQPDSRRNLARVDNLMRQLGDIATAPEIVQMRGEALSSLSQSEAEQEPEHRSQPRWRRGHAVAALATVLLCAGVLLQVFLQPATQVYRTPLGERRTVQLADGSTLSMDSNTEVEAAFSGRARYLALRRGQARFEVAHGKPQPFIVEAGGNAVLATGTSFNIDRVGQRVEVTLLKGRVVVTPSGEGASRVNLVPGDQLTAVKGRKAVVRQVDVQAATAWEAGRIVIDEESVTSVIQRLDRYAPRRWNIDPRVGGVLISGVFDTGNTDAFLDALSHFAPIDVETDQAGVTHLKPKPQGATKNISGTG